VFPKLKPILKGLRIEAEEKILGRNLEKSYGRNKNVGIVV
jgi:hypothetical protein